MQHRSLYGWMLNYARSDLTGTNLIKSVSILLKLRPKNWFELFT